VWSETYSQEVWQEGHGPTITTWLLLPVAIVVLALELLLGVAISGTYATNGTSGAWIGALLAALLGLTGPIGATSGWRAGRKRSEPAIKKLGRTVRRALAIGILPTLFLLAWLVPLSIM